MTTSRYEELQELTTQYGEYTWAFYNRVHDAGSKIIESYSAFLGGPKSAANGVPPYGEFEPRGLYRDASFSSHERGTTYLEPIFMGICTEIGNKADDGATWVRTVIEFKPSGSELVALVGVRSRRAVIGQEPSAAMEAICEAIFEDVREAFSAELDEASGRTRIGFIAARE
ncbi:hypothetical protein [Rhizobium sullae]|uniref:hypothetical protein n=1 Tax=Rhizobium sullae TaxID=50338 RepID=UPI000B3527DF|nr:hypothetical protein [Rhizobium sullae]